MTKREEQIVFWRQGSHENFEGHEIDNTVSNTMAMIIAQHAAEMSL